WQCKGRRSAKFDTSTWAIRTSWEGCNQRSVSEGATEQSRARTGDGQSGVARHQHPVRGRQEVAPLTFSPDRMQRGDAASCVFRTVGKRGNVEANAPSAKACQRLLQGKGPPSTRHSPPSIPVTKRDQYPLQFGVPTACIDTIFHRCQRLKHLVRGARRGPTHRLS